MEPTLQHLRRLIPGRPLLGELSASNLNQSIDTIDQLRKSLATNKPVSKIGDGVVSAVRIGIVTDRGPNAPTTGDPPETGDDAEFEDQRYWVKLAAPTSTLAPGSVFTSEARTAPGLAGTVRATNLGEDGTHTLNTDGSQVVLLFRVVYQTAPTTEHWVFVQGSTGGGIGLAWVRITSTATGGGKYLGHVLVANDPFTPIDPATDLTSAELGTSDVVEVLILNAFEAGKGEGHWLNPASGPIDYPATYHQTNPADGETPAIAVYKIYAFQPVVRDCAS